MVYFAALVLVAVLIVIHEFGHFVVAKLFGVNVLTFSVGFGRRLAGFRFGGTDYRLSLLPFGGYVQMEGADPFMDGGTDGDLHSEGAMLNKPVWQRLLIIAAGPVSNLALPVVLFAGLAMGGEPQVATSVETVLVGEPAWEAGIREGDQVRAVAGEPVIFWGDFYRVLGRVADPGDTVSLTLERNGSAYQADVRIPARAEETETGLSPAWMGMDYMAPDATVGVSDNDSPAARSGLQTGDEVLSVEGAEVDTYGELMAALAGVQQATLKVAREVDGELQELSLTLTADPGWAGPELLFEDPRANAWGVYPGYLFVREISEDSAASEANILVGDRLAAIDGRGLTAWSEVVERIGAKQEGEGSGSDAVPLVLTLVRDGRVIEETVLPRIVRDTDGFGRYRYRALVGISALGSNVVGPTTPRYYGPVEALGKGVDETIGLATFVLEQVGKLVTFEADPRKTLGGPVQIVRDAKAAAEAGIYTYVRMMGALSISLGIINFLPVPVLDGGQFLFYLAEGIRGRPLSLAIRERAQQVGVLFLVALMFAVMVMDVDRWIQQLTQ